LTILFSGNWPVVTPQLIYNFIIMDSIKISFIQVEYFLDDEVVHG